MKPFALTALLLLASALPALAQAPFPGAVSINGGWVPCTSQIAITAGKGCLSNDQPGPKVVRGPIASPIQVGKYYRNANNNCLIRTLAIAVTHFHRVPMIVGERVDAGARPGYPEESWGCPEVAYFFRPDYPPGGNWFEIDPASIGVDW